MTFINGAKYEGGYKEDKRHNLGTYMHADGEIRSTPRHVNACTLTKHPLGT